MRGGFSHAQAERGRACGLGVSAGLLVSYLANGDVQVLGIGPQRWQMPDSAELPVDYLADCARLTRELVWRRGFRTQAEAHRFLHPLDFRLPPLGSYPSVSAAVDRIDAALAGDEKTHVWGDFDVDGQTATALLVGALRRVGGNVDYYIPNRITESHGLNSKGLERIASVGCSLVITCDCGTNDIAMIDYARSLALDVIVTDHHLQTGRAPAAVAICNSSHVDRSDPIWGVSGVAMAYLVVRDLYARRGIPSQVLSDLDLVALGTIADLAPLSIANRAFLARGLPRLWNSHRAGLVALLELIGTPAGALDSTKISYKLAPLLNASGRLADASLAVELLLATDSDSARTLAQRLYALNAERRRLAELLENEVDTQLAANSSTEEPIVFAVGDDWHLGLLGPAASHYAALLSRPAMLISRLPGASLARGSVRSNGSCDILAVLAEHSHLLIEWGGHAGAAGFTLRAEDVHLLRTAFAGSVASRQCCASEGELHVDGEVDWSQDSGEVGVETVYGQVALLEPFSEGNATPVLATRDVVLVARRQFGREGVHADLVFADRRGVERALKWWRHNPDWRGTGRYDIAYTMAVDAWQGRTRVRLTMVAARPAAGSQHVSPAEACNATQ